MKRVMEVVTSKLNRSARRKIKPPKALLSIDSTTITVGKTRLPSEGQYSIQLEEIASGQPS